MSPVMNNPQRIEAESFRIIDASVEETEKMKFSPLEWMVARRAIHTTGDLDFCKLMRFSRGAVQLGVDILKRGCTVYADTRMLMAGISTGRLDELGVEVVCLVSDQETRDLARRRGITRSAASVDRVFEEPDLKHNIKIFAIGNAPTALFRLLHWVDGSPRAEDRVSMETDILVIGTPVGFVGAKESKDALMASGIPYISCIGTRGGSTVAASILNQLAIEALEQR